ncbi:hypothetical protein BZL54_09115 [Burkholderia ubonensis subsp. mesacidophila]|uniref:DNA-binding protein n=1 Tax=Burkholderia ubonensis subsp. mesacidophila TaxID=265293 RepID=A0A2A4FHF1_9BURK|nr:hypothetical protein BZL54_09115 [Burkholderia ubonensis subsp. mesacidophila]
MENDLRIAYASEIIDRLGGTGAVADLFEIDDAAVSQWRRNGIPKPRMQFISVARPDVLVGLGPCDRSDRSGVAGNVSRNRARIQSESRRRSVA